MENKTNRVPYPYYDLSWLLKYELETLRNSYRRKKEQAFFNQCKYAKKKSHQNRVIMNKSFYECSEYKHKIRQMEKWLKELDKERDLQKENRVIWHDLRKNPGDLPKVDRLVRVRLMNEMEHICETYYYEPSEDEIGYGKFILSFSELNGEWIDDNEIIAWCEIPKFEEKE